VGLDITSDGTLDYFINFGGNPNQEIAIVRAGATGNNSPDSLSIGSTLYSTTANASNSLFTDVGQIDTGLNDDLSTFPDVDRYDLDGGGKKTDLDHLLTFSLNFNELVTVIRADATGPSATLPSEYALFDDTFLIQMLVVTSQNTNNVNSDVGGVDDDDPTSVTALFTDPVNGGGLSNPVDPAGIEAVPEPATYALGLGLACLAFVGFRRRSA
jgi:hypothetical protein